jgi:hypothetical protein
VSVERNSGRRIKVCRVNKKLEESLRIYRKSIGAKAEAMEMEFLSPSALHDAAQRGIHLIHFGMCEVPISKHPLKSKSHKCVQRSAAQQEISFHGNGLGHRFGFGE